MLKTILRSLHALIHLSINTSRLCYEELGPSSLNKSKICQQQDKWKNHPKKTLENCSGSWLVLLIPGPILEDEKSQKSLRLEESAAFDAV